MQNSRHLCEISGICLALYKQPPLGLFCIIITSIGVWSTPLHSIYPELVEDLCHSCLLPSSNGCLYKERQSQEISQRCLQFCIELKTTTKFQHAYMTSIDKIVQNLYLAFCWFYQRSVWFVSSLATSFPNFLSELVSNILQDFRGSSWQALYSPRKKRILSLFQFPLFLTVNINHFSIIF